MTASKLVRVNVTAYIKVPKTVVKPCTEKVIRGDCTYFSRNVFLPTVPRIFTV